jgi:ClpP class serine protease
MAILDHFNEFAGRIGGPLVRKDVPLVAVVRLQGAIGVGGFGRQSLSAQSVDGALRRAFAKSKIDAIALQINSPGGSPVQSALIATRIRQLAEEKEKPVYAFTEDVRAATGWPAQRTKYTPVRCPLSDQSV